MSGLKPIGDYFRLFERLSLGSYLAHNPPAVLLQDASAGSFTAVSGEVGDTVTREGNVGFDAGGAAPGFGAALPREVAFMVVRLQSSQEPESTLLLLGSSVACDIILPDQSVSRKHAWIERRGNDYFVSDSNSTHGTWVGGSQLVPGAECQLTPGERLTLGTMDLTFLDATGFYHFVSRFFAS